MLAAGCGGDDDAPGSSSPSSKSAAFPAEVEHQFGTTTVPAKPKRIVVVGVTEQDTVLALGYKPIASTEWYGDQPSAVWPWAQDELGDSKPTVLDVTDGFQFEKIAGLRPDLIIGVNAGMDRTDYKKLARLAPTVAAAKGSTASFSPWDKQVALIAAALGKPEEGRALVERIKGDYANTDGILTGAIYFISPLSQPYVLERLTPQLKAAVEGKAPQKIVDTS